MKIPKYFICPMSKNIVDSVIELNSDNFALLPTRRQVEWDGGYVNNWTTEEFFKYIRDKSNILVERDHSGPNQGKVVDDGYESYSVDSKYFDILHIDPWKLFENDLIGGVDNVSNAIKFLHNLNPNLKFEVGTEEVIRKFNEEEICMMMDLLKSKLTDEQYSNIVFIVIQSGVGLNLQEMKNIGNFDLKRLKTMVNICTKYQKKSKEHNGDYLSNDEIKLRFDNGLDSINIGPEIAQIETLCYLNRMSNKQINEYYDICLNSGKWKKWVNDKFDIKDKKKLIQVCGHYSFSEYELPNINDEIKETIKNKLNNLPQ